MKTFQKIATLIVVVLLLATGYGLFRTKSLPDTAANTNSAASRTNAALQVDQSTLWTARWLAQMPTSAEERQVAEDALQLADKEMDLAFATALRDAELHPPTLSSEAQKIEARVQKAEAAVAADQAKVTQITAQEKIATGKKKDQLDTEMNLAKAQAELDQDEVDDGKEDLLRAGGDQQARIRSLGRNNMKRLHKSRTIPKLWLRRLTRSAG